MSEYLFTTIYAASLFALLGTFAVRLVKARGKYFRDRLPGRVFRVLGNLNILNRADFDETCDHRYRNMISDLEDIANDVCTFTNEKHTYELKLNKDAVRIIQNTGRCMKTFSQAVYNDPRRHEMSFRKFNKGIDQLVSTINRFVLLDGVDSDIDDFKRRIIKCKEQIYFSLLGRRRVDKKITNEFLNDFLGLVNGKPIVEYLECLEEKWIIDNSRLRYIDRSLIIPLFSTWNIVKHLNRWAAGSIVAIARLPEWDQLLYAMSSPGRIWRLSYIGLTYDQDKVAERLLMQANGDFDKDAFINKVITQAMYASRGELKEAHLDDSSYLVGNMIDLD